ncbi:MAG: tRNA uridine-5-carboxymethylaminomethyl(34) synthesis GTPase MnmE [Geothermobacteraceae bacterium]
MRTDTTIVAPATPSGEGGLAVIRLSGPDAEGVLRRLFRPARQPCPFESHRLYYGHIVENSGMVDEVMAVLMRAPASFTREDVAEIHCHGGPVIVRRILDLCLSSGAVMAAPGEFTLRAFLNGRIDLAQAEAVAGLIHARSESARRVALDQLNGELSQCLRAQRSCLVELLAHIETHIDFVEEDIEFPDADIWLQRITELQSELARLRSSYRTGRLLHDGLRVLILGKPNVGKSSLLNSLLGQARAIVSDIPGTTRDTIEEHLILNGIPVQLIDTAGIRQTHDAIELAGIERARTKVDSADLILFMVDGSRPCDGDDQLVADMVPEARTLLVINKEDLGSVSLPSWANRFRQVTISAKLGNGLDDLQNSLVGLLGKTDGDSSENLILYERRHFDALGRCLDSLGGAKQGLEQGLSPEFIALDVRAALAALGEVTGETTPDEVLEQIFSQFCIGK